MKRGIQILGMLTFVLLIAMTQASADIQATVSGNQLEIVLTNDGEYAGSFSFQIFCNGPLSARDIATIETFSLQSHESKTYNVIIDSSNLRVPESCGECTMVFTETTTREQAIEVVPICVAGTPICTPGDKDCGTDSRTGRKIVIQCSQDGYEWITLETCGEGEVCLPAEYKCSSKELEAAANNQNMLILALIVIIIALIAMVYYFKK